MKETKLLIKKPQKNICECKNKTVLFSIKKYEQKFQRALCIRIWSRKMWWFSTTNTRQTKPTANTAKMRASWSSSTLVAHFGKNHIGMVVIKFRRKLPAIHCEHLINKMLSIRRDMQAPSNWFIVSRRNQYRLEKNFLNSLNGIGQYSIVIHTRHKILWHKIKRKSWIIR